jgi:AraC-like DNA-binding protein/riboflavin transporter FmnP
MSPPVRDLRIASRPDTDVLRLTAGSHLGLTFILSVHLSFDWIQLAAAVGAVQGFVLAAVLVAHHGKRTANRLLATLMAAFAIYLAATVYYAAGLVRAYPQFYGITYPLPWAFGPLVYLYAATASDDNRRLRARDALHFAPVILVVIAALPIYVSSGADKIALHERMQAGHTPALFAVLNPFKYVSGLSYSIATVLYLRRHARNIENSYSNTANVNLSWLRWLSAAAAAIWLLAAAMWIARLGPNSIWRYSENVISLAIALLVYAIGYMGLRQPEIYSYDSAKSPSPNSATQSPEREPYERSGLGVAEAAKLKAQLLSLMTRERPYRNPELTLAQLAEQLDTTPHKLSEVLNRELAQTFYDFVNGYRVNEIRQRLVESKSAHLSVLTLAMDAGFASKSTFNQVFKKLTGQTPSSYRNTVGA